MEIAFLSKITTFGAMSDGLTMAVNANSTIHFSRISLTLSAALSPNVLYNWLKRSVGRFTSYS